MKQLVPSVNQAPARFVQIIAGYVQRRRRPESVRVRVTELREARS